MPIFLSQYSCLNTGLAPSCLMGASEKPNTRALAIINLQCVYISYVIEEILILFDNSNPLPTKSAQQ